MPAVLSRSTQLLLSERARTYRRGIPRRLADRLLSVVFNDLGEWTSRRAKRENVGRCPTIHLFLLWSNARREESAIRRDIDNEFAILEVFEIHWSRAWFSENLTRLYSRNLPSASHKEEHCGVGPFLVIVIRDDSPTQGRRVTSRGLSSINTRLFDARRRYRRWTGGGHRVHAAVTEPEADHDLFLLVGERVDRYTNPHAPEGWDGSVQQLEADLVGAHGWRNLTELLQAIEVTTDYVAIGDLNLLDEVEFKQADSNRQLTLLVVDVAAAMTAVNPLKISEANGNRLCRVSVGEQSLCLELQSLEDPRIIENRLRHPSGAFVAAQSHGPTASSKAAPT